MVKPGTTAEHLVKAQAFLRAVKALLDAGLAERAVSEAYYAAFHTAQALLATAGLAAESHSGVQTLLARHFVKDGPLPPGVARAFSHLMADRLLADYGVDRQIDEAGGAQAVAAAFALVRDLLAAVESRAPEAGSVIATLRRELSRVAPDDADPRA
jgi:uncharacterized protein (UPF0332 family)